MMQPKARLFSCSAAICLSLALCPTGARAQATYYTRTALVSDVSTEAPVRDLNLRGSWGLAAAPNGPWWVSDEQDGLSTVYTATGTIVPTLVSVPSAQFDNTKNGSPTGIVYNPSSSDFLGASFIYCTYDGTISALLDNAPVTTVEVDNGAIGSRYTGLAIVETARQTLLYAANFAAGTIETYDTSFASVNLGSGAFTDPELPSGFHPFNIAVFGSHVFVAYAEYSSSGVVVGSGNGFIDAYTAKGVLELRFAHGNYLNAPWGMALAPSSFGQFSGDLLVGQQGSGVIIAFNVSNGAEAGVLQTAASTVLEIPEIWGIAFGTGGEGGPSTTLYFTSALQNDKNGVYGTVVSNTP